MKLANTFKHALGGTLIGFISGLVFWAIAVAMILYAWEAAQYYRSQESGKTFNWTDSIVDWLAGYASFSQIFWLIQYCGGYFA
jgi:hypothetical protein